MAHVIEHSSFLWVQDEENLYLSKDAPLLRPATFTESPERQRELTAILGDWLNRSGIGVGIELRLSSFETAGPHSL